MNDKLSNISIDTYMFDRYNLLDIATLIQLSIVSYQELHPEDTTQKGPADYALKKVLTLGKGIYNPDFFKRMISLERSCYRGDTMLQC